MGRPLEAGGVGTPGVRVRVRVSFQVCASRGVRPVSEVPVPVWDVLACCCSCVGGARGGTDGRTGGSPGSWGGSCVTGDEEYSRFIPPDLQAGWEYSPWA